MTLAALLDVHKNFAWFVIIGNALAGIWALAAHRYPSLRSRALWWYTGVAQLSVFVQVTLGVILVQGDKVNAPHFHMLYGFAAIVAVAIIYAYRFELEQYRYLLYGGGGLFIMGLGIRAMLVGRT